MGRAPESPLSPQSPAHASHGGAHSKEPQTGKFSAQVSPSSRSLLRDPSPPVSVILPGQKPAMGPGRPAQDL